MINLAIVIGVSKYNNADKLLACKNDAEAINTILDEAHKYDDVLFCNEEVDSINLKNDIVEFVKTYKSEDVNELFFYFSGHGFSNDDDFYFVTSDTDIKKINSTSLQNSELDSLVRELSPKLYVKIVDACHSGISYIKDADLDIGKRIFEKSFKEKSLENLFFMYSSLANQSSYTEGEISSFTRGLITGIDSFENNTTIRYKQIIDFISDYFSDNENQKPYFVAQSSMTDEFATVTQDMKTKISGYLNGAMIGKVVGEIEIDQKLNDLFLKCATLDETKSQLEKILNIISEYEVNSNVVDKYYRKSQAEVLESEIDESTIGKWVAENKKARILFAVPLYEEQTIDNPFLPNIFNKKTKVICGYENRVDDLSFGQTIYLIPEKIGLPRFKMKLYFVYSPTCIYIFYRYGIQYPINWEDFIDESNVEWKYCIIETKNYNENVILDMMNSLQIYIIESLEKYFESAIN